MKYLVEQGIEPDRLEAVGWGEERPIDSNETKEGRASNRRVEFNIVTGGSDAVQQSGNTPEMTGEE